MRLLFLLSVLITASEINALAQNRVGTYDRKDKYGNGTLKIREASRSIISFNIRVGNSGSTLASFCVGELKGKAKWVAFNTAEYNERDKQTSEAVRCRLTLVFSGNRIVVRETHCDHYHGVACQFEGSYIRKGFKGRGRSR